MHKKHLNDVLDRLVNNTCSIQEAVALLEQPWIPPEGSDDLGLSGKPQKFVDMFVERTDLTNEEKKKWFYGDQFIISYCVLSDEFYIKDKIGKNHKSLDDSDLEKRLRKGFLRAAEAGREIYAVNDPALSETAFPDNERVH